MKAIKAHYDGRVVVLEEPIADDSVAIAKAFANLSEPSFSRIWDNDDGAGYDKL